MADPWQIPVNHSFTSAYPQPTSAPQGKVAAHQTRIDAVTRRREFRDATATLCEDIIASATAKDVNVNDFLTLRVFHLFPKLPIELRLKIWQHAINVPRFIEFDQLAARTYKIPPPVLYGVCRESHNEVMQAYKPDATERATSKTQWVRFEHDIIHIKPTPFPSVLAPDVALISAACAKRGREYTPIRRWKSDGMRNVDTDRWTLGLPPFDRTKTLAISRDFLVHLPDDYECFIRHFFPKLLVLIVLIDEEIDIDEDWGIHDLEYGRYEKCLPRKLRSFENPHNIPRFDLAKKCKGPFKEVKLNVDYRMDIEYEMRKRIAQEETDYPAYTAPRIRVLGASARKGVYVDKCGRLPPKPVEDRKHNHDISPFGDFNGDNDFSLSS